MDVVDFASAIAKELDFRAPNASTKEAREAIQSIKHAIEDVLAGRFDGRENTLSELAEQATAVRGSLEPNDWSVSKKLTAECVSVLGEHGLRKHKWEARVVLYPLPERSASEILAGRGK